jgi:polyisoprenoid-binding protein YceI
MIRFMKSLMVMSFAFALVEQPSAAAWARNLSSGPASSVWLVGDSTLHPFSSRSTQLQASGLLDPQTTTTAVGTSFYESVLHQQDLKTFDVAIPVTSLKSKEAALDKNMYKALKAEACPTIAFHLSNYAVAKDTATAGNFVAKVNGLLTIACQQQPVMFDTVLTPGTDAMHVVGQYTLLMTDYGVKPPTLMMGAIKVKNEVTIHFDLRLDDSAR